MAGMPGSPISSSDTPGGLSRITDRQFRRFVLYRSQIMGTAMSVPYPSRVTLILDKRHANRLRHFCEYRP